MPAGPGRAWLRAATLKLSLLVLLCGLCAVAVRGQTAVDGAVRGTVTDPAGSLLAQVRVRISSPSTAFFEQTVSGRDGSFLFARVPPGEYNVSADVPGFASQTVQHIVVELGSVSNVTVRLGIAGAAANVTVNT